MYAWVRYKTGPHWCEGEGRMVPLNTIKGGKLRCPVCRKRMQPWWRMDWQVKGAEVPPHKTKGHKRKSK